MILHPRPPILDDPAVAHILAALPRARLVGGVVRDILAERPVADIDLATPDTPDAVIAALAEAGLRTVPTGLAHGTVTAIDAGRPFEITTLRQDVQTDGRHATVAWTDDWQTDAARRDFTFNAMSLSRDGVLHDYFGGAADLAAGRVRFVGDAAARIAEDYLRILRFFRFQARYGTGDPDPDAAMSIAAAVAGLRTLSVERVWSELKRILAVPDPVAALTLMDRLGVLRTLFPGRTTLAHAVRMIEAGAPADPVLRLAALVPENPAVRLKMSGAEAARFLAMRQPPTPYPSATMNDLRRMLADTGAATLIDRTWLTGESGAGWTDLRARLAVLPRPVFPLEGRDALAMGATAGPHIGEALRLTRLWWLEGGCCADQGQIRDYLRALLAARISPPRGDPAT